jgi:adenosylcobinamide-GDP ribazoletransferase
MSPRREIAGAGGIRVLAMVGEIVRCLRFYSRIPVPALTWESDPHGPPDFRTMPRVVPVAGALIGCFGGAAVLAGHTLGLGAFVTAALAIAVLTLVTGAFHEDGLADTADGFGGGTTPERRLEIMKDSRIGSYGGAALVLAYALRIACLAELIAAAGAANAAAAGVLTAALSRTAALIVMAALPPARVTGSAYAAGQAPVASVGTAWLICAALGLVLVFTTSLRAAGVALGFVLAAAAAVVMTRLSRRLIGGQTGDVGGAIQQVAEIAAFIGLLIAAKP